MKGIFEDLGIDGDNIVAISDCHIGIINFILQTFHLINQCLDRLPIVFEKETSFFVNLIICFDQIVIELLGLLAFEIFNSLLVFEDIFIYLHIILRQTFQKVFLEELFSTVEHLREDLVLDLR